MQGTQVVPQDPPEGGRPSSQHSGAPLDTPSSHCYSNASKLPMQNYSQVYAVAKIFPKAFWGVVLRWFST